VKLNRILFAALSITAATWISSALAQDKGTVGISMPTKSSARWIADGDNMVKVFKEKGYKTDLQYADDDIPNQLAQIENMITKGSKVLVIAAIDGTTLSGALQKAADKGIKVIAYDRLIRGSKNVDYYTTFDNFKVGVLQAGSIVDCLGLKDGKGPFNIELFAGSLDDNNAHFFYQGAMDTLKPYIDDKTLVVKSGQTKIEQVATLRWLQETAQKRMEDLLTSTYSDGSKVQGVLSPYDGLSRGIITALQNAGYGPGIDAGMPIVTGQDSEIASVKLINDGVQYSSVFKDTRKLADQAVTAAQDFLAGKTPEANDTKSYNNGVKVVPSYLLNSDVVVKDNIQKLLIDSGYWTADEVASGQAAS
jgi:putative multiple sugar transport system substrate-binding protein